MGPGPPPGSSGFLNSLRWARLCGLRLMFLPSRRRYRLFELKTWSPETVDRLMSYEVPSGVDVNVKL